jgi:transcriptional regulator with XRE-family HTH domain
MQKSELSKRIKELRSQKGISQEELAEESSLSLRTVQRIENGETEPRGDSLKRIAIVLGASPDELIDWSIQENRGYLSLINISALTFIVFPLLGVIIPYILLVAKQDKIKDLSTIGKSIVNFEITWCIIIFFLYLMTIPILIDMTSVGSGVISLGKILVFALIIVLYFYNLLLVLLNSIRIQNNREVKYFPQFRFLK